MACWGPAQKIGVTFLSLILILSTLSSPSSCYVFLFVCFGFVFKVNPGSCLIFPPPPPHNQQGILESISHRTFLQVEHILGPQFHYIWGGALVSFSFSLTLQVILKRILLILKVKLFNRNILAFRDMTCLRAP